MIKLNITRQEQSLLKEYLRTTPLILIRFKSQAILMRSKGMKFRDIGDIVSRDEQTVGRWIKDWENCRIASIFTGHENNENASKLTKRQKKEIKKVLQKPPSKEGLPQQFWDVPTLKQYVQATFGVVYESKQSYHFLLSFSNLSFKYPDTFDRHRNEALITERMNEIRKEIRPFLRDSNWEVFASDEVRIQLEALTRRAWLRRGKRTILKVERKREAQNYLGLLNQKSFHCHLYEVNWQNQEEILKAMTKFLKKYPNKKICVVWDNARFHKGKEIKKALQKGESLQRVHLINLPPYAPDKNPIELVWGVAKEAISNIQYDDFKKTKIAFQDFVDSKIFKYQI